MKRSSSIARRRLLVIAGSAGIAAIAGCFGSDTQDDETADDGDDVDNDSDDDAGDDQLSDDIDDEDFDIGHEDEPEHGQGGHDVDVSELLVYDDGEQVANSHAGHWHYETDTSALPTIEEGSAAEFEAVFHKDGDELPLGEDEQYRLDVSVASGADEALVDLDIEPTSVSISGTETGQTAVVFQLVEDGKAVWEAPEIETIIEA